MNHEERIQLLERQIYELRLTRAERAMRSFRRNKRLVIGLLAVLAPIPLSLYAASITKSFTFTAGSAAVAAELNANFDELFTKVNELDGKVAQTVIVSNSNYLSTIATIPNDDTMPQSTEGVQVLTASITPRKNTNLLIVSLSVPMSSSASNHVTAALFKDAGVDAIAVSNITAPGADFMVQPSLEFRMISGTTSSVTFSVRVGSNAGNLYVNGQSVGRRYGGVMAAYLKIVEIEP